MRFPPIYRAATGATVGRPDSMEFCVVPVFRIPKRRSLVAVVLLAMALSACGDRRAPPSAAELHPDDAAAHAVLVKKEPGATGKHGLEKDPRAAPFLLHLRCRLSRCSLIVRLKQSRLLRALLK